MKIFVDENIPLETIQALRMMGHDVLDIQSQPIVRRGPAFRLRDVVDLRLIELADSYLERLAVAVSNHHYIDGRVRFGPAHHVREVR